MAETATRRRTRGGGRAGAAARRGAAVIEQMPWNPPVITDAPTEPLSPEGVAAIHDGAMRILEEIGIQFLNEEALGILREAGCTIDGDIVRMDRDFVMEMVGKAPSQFTLTPRNPNRKLTVGGRHLLFGNVSSPPNYWDMEIGTKVPGTREMCANLLKLTQYFNCIHFAGGYPVEPVDLHASVRQLDVLFDINSTSPLKHDQPMIDGWLRMIRRGQAVVVTPFTLAGAMAPVTMAGAVAQSIAEALCAIALFQYVAPGAPCAIGTFTSNVDMKSGAPAFGTPEYMRATQMTGQLARFYGLPMRSSGVCAANVPDGQASWETSNSLWAAVQSGSNMVYHAAGWLEGGLIASPEKFIMDCEILQQIQRYMEPAIVGSGPDDTALDAGKSVGNEGHFFGIQHTQDRYSTAFYQPFLSDWKNYEGWDAAGAIWTPERAHRMFKDIIGSFEAPPMDVAIREELADFVARRKAEGGAPTDF